ncbi:MAG TPA: hypothetical protein PLG87_00775 [Treponemataceae bacterium]|nr:hypothetical protein [Treponemataceae bacterium]
MNNDLYDILEIKKEYAPDFKPFSTSNESKTILKGFGLCIAADTLMIIVLSVSLSGWDRLWAIIAPLFFTAAFIIVFVTVRAVICLKHQHWKAFFIYTLILLFLLTLLDYVITQ